MFKLFSFFLIVLFSNLVNAKEEQHPFVFFDTGKSIPIQHKIILNGKLKGTDTFWVRGFSDPTGNYDANIALSKKRVDWVRRRLIESFSIPESQIITTYTGIDWRPNVPNSEKRRVEIYSGKHEHIVVLVKKETEKPKRVTRKISNKEEKKEVGPVRKEGRKKRYHIGAGVHQSTLEVKNHVSIDAEWISKTNLNVEGQFQMLLGSLWIGLNASFYQQKYKQQDNLNYIWDQKTPNLYGFSLVFDHEKERFGFGADLNYRRAAFMSLSGNVVKFQDAGIYGAAIRAQYKWYDGSEWSSRLGVALDYPISGSGELKPKGELGYIGFVDLRKNNLIVNHSVKTKVFYGLRKHKLIGSKQEEKIVGLQLFFMSPFWQ